MVRDAKAVSAVTHKLLVVDEEAESIWKKKLQCPSHTGHYGVTCDETLEKKMMLCY